MFNLAMLSLSPNEGATDEPLGREWLQKAAQTGLPQAQSMLAGKLTGGADGFPKDPAQAFNLAKAAADKGDAYGAAALGDLYRDGIGRPVDAAEAVNWYRIAAYRGSPYAQFELAKAYLSGRGTQRDPSQALFWVMVVAPSANSAQKERLSPVREQAERELTPPQRDDIREKAASWRPGSP